jgi:uncharacterized protein YjbI with pentapeptide repeats
MNRKHYDKLKEGVGAWNKWRKEWPVLKPDLRNADLLEADLRGAYLRKADFRKADLRQADLRGAYLRKADLRKAHLWRADLREADLQGAYFRKAKLWGADLRQADLRGASFLNAKQLSEAKSLYRTELDPDLEKQVIKWCPHLLEEPKEQRDAVIQQPMIQGGKYSVLVTRYERKAKKSTK